MSILRRLVNALLLACVALALGDAPYVDEFLDDLAAANAAGAIVTAIGHPVEKPASSQYAPRISRICQNLLNLPAAPREIHLAAALHGRDDFPDMAPVSFSSAHPGRIERPPASLAA